MKQSMLSVWLRVMIVLVMLIVVMVYFWLAKVAVDIIEGGAPGPDMQDALVLIMLGTIVPIAAGALIAWRIAINIGNDMSFTEENSKNLLLIAALTAADAVVFTIGAGMAIPMGLPAVIVLFAIFAVVMFAAVSCVAAGLSHLTMKAALIRQENELTI